MPNYLRNLILLVVLSTWFAYILVDILLYHTLPPYEALLVPSATIAAVSRPGLIGKVARKVIPKNGVDE